MIKNLLLLTVFSMTSLLCIAPVVQADNETKENLCSGANLSLEGDEGPQASCQPSESENSLDNLIATIVNILSVIVGIVAVIMIIIGGFKYITSGGDSAGISSAKNTILYAVVGLIIVALAQFIVKFVLSKL